MKVSLTFRRSIGTHWLGRALFGDRRRACRRRVNAQRSIPRPEYLETRLAFANGASLVLDINAVNQNADPRSFAVVGDVAYFAATDSAHGRELWRTDGTKAGTTLVADIDPNGDGAPDNLTVVGSKVFFTASSGGDRELWITDGTTAGTTLVKNIKTVDPDGWDPSSNPRWLTPLGERLFFSADDGIHGRELWVSDGTEPGTYLVKDLDPQVASWGPLSGTPLELTAFDGKVYFSAYFGFSITTGGWHENPLWCSDGTEEGTFVVDDFHSLPIFRPSE